MSILPSSATSTQETGALAPPTLSATHYLVAHKLLQGRSKASISRSLSISPYTINQMLQESEFCLLMEQLQEEKNQQFILSKEEIQHKLDIDVINSLECIQDIRDGLFIDAPTANTRLKAATTLLDKASNMPKPSKEEEKGAVVNVFSPTFIQTLVETARQIGDESVFKSANQALSTVAAKDRIIDLNEEKADYTPEVEAKPLMLPIMPIRKVKTLEELLSSNDPEEEEDD